MPHNIWGERFYSLRTAAWHNLGEVGQEEESAESVLGRMGEPTYSLRPLYASMPSIEHDPTNAETPLTNGTRNVLLPQRVIVRHPYQEEVNYAPMGVVGPDYQLITPGMLAGVWDERVTKPVETMGFLGKGSTFFLTSKLPTIDVKGDEVEMYLGAVCPLEAGRAASAEVWPLRVVCQNTLRVAEASAVDRYRIVHDDQALTRMGDWLAEMMTRATAEVEVLKEAFTVLADTQVSVRRAPRVLKAAYPDPKRPGQNAPAADLEAREERYEAKLRRVEGYRTKALELFDGGGTGMMLAAAQGTAWGLFNAVTETENFRRGWNRDGQEAAITGEQVLFGHRADVMRRAYTACKELVSA